MPDAYVRGGTATTIRDYIKGAENLTSRRRLEVALPKKFGRFKYNCGGDGFSWQAEFQQAVAQDNDGTQSVTPTSVDRYRQAFLDYQGGLDHDRITKREMLKNAKPSDAQIVDVLGGMTDKLLRDLEDHFCSSFYNDGGATTTRPSGTRTWAAYTQTFQNAATTPTARTANAADPLAYPSDTYAGLSTIVANIAGSWTSGDYRTGTGTSSYDFWSPIIIRGLSTYFSSTGTWPANCVEAIKLGTMLNLRQKPADGGALDCYLMDATNMWFPLSNRLDAKERVVVSEAWNMPHYGMDQNQGVIMIDGVKCTWSYDVPTSEAYGINWKSVQFRSMQPTLFQLDKKSPEWISRERSLICIADYLGQWKFRSPRDFTHIDIDYSN